MGDSNATDDDKCPVAAFDTRKTPPDNRPTRAKLSTAPLEECETMTIDIDDSGTCGRCSLGSCTSLFVAWMAAPLGLAACSSNPSSDGASDEVMADEASEAATDDSSTDDASEGSDDQAVESGLILRAVDESGVPLPGATVELGSDSFITDDQGEVTLPNPSEVVVVVIEGEGLLAEPLVVGPSDADSVVEVRVLSDLGGTRWVMHAGGDFMLGRRYEDPDEGAPLLPANDIAEGSRQVVEPLARAFLAADYRMVNVETVLTNRPEAEAYPKKRIVIASKPETVAGLQALGVDAAMLGNNHIRDWLDEGVTETMAALDDAGVPHVGASDDDDLAHQPLILEKTGVRVGVLSWATMDGAAVNDRYAKDGDPVSSDPERAWEYEARLWSFSGGTWTVPAQMRRIGTAWSMFDAAEPDLSDDEATMAWNSLEAVYPELQDYVAHRGHGGAAKWVTADATDRIAALADEVDVVVVQVHTGAEFWDAPSDRAAEVAHAAIDAGADIVITHHPHVVQGAEWYKGKLIVHSLGNLVFDQDHFITFPSAFLRTVWEGDQLLEARFVPLMLEGYRPKLVGEAMFTQQAEMLWERSQTGAVVDDDANGDDRAFLNVRHPDARDAHLRLRGRALHVDEAVPAVAMLDLDVPAATTLALDYAGLIHARAGGAELLIGRDILDWGSFEEALADGGPTGEAYWKIEGTDAEVITGMDAGEGNGHLRLRLSADAVAEITAHPIARVPIPEHRFHTDEGGQAIPADGDATYTVRLLARAQGNCAAQVRLDFYESDGSRPSDSSVQSEQLFALDVEADGNWHVVELQVPGEVLMVEGERMGAVLTHVILNPPEAGSCELGIDDVRLIEWRPAADMPDFFGAYDFVHNPGAVAVAAQLPAMPLQDD
jgi:poly-gamma-glutamate capsule biosynthesis protein CapA/YwtB (metallophosphatase superfamily)